jgi:hypothetical protein
MLCKTTMVCGKQTEMEPAWFKEKWRDALVFFFFFFFLGGGNLI